MFFCQEEQVSEAAVHEPLGEAVWESSWVVWNCMQQFGSLLAPLQEMSVIFATLGEEPTSFPVSSPCQPRPPQPPHPTPSQARTYLLAGFIVRGLVWLVLVFINVDFFFLNTCL